MERKKILYIVDGAQEKKCHQKQCRFFSEQPCGLLLYSCMAGVSNGQKRGIFESTGKMRKLLPCDYFRPRKKSEEPEELRYWMPT